MKKMNLKIFGLGAKMVLPLFLLFGLFLISTNTASAQYVPRAEAIQLLRAHVSQLPDTAFAPAQRVQQYPSAADAERNTANFRKLFGMVLLHNLDDEGLEVADAIARTVDLAVVKQIDDKATEVIKEEYVVLLSD